MRRDDRHQPLRIGVVNRFRTTHDRYLIGAALEAAGAQWVPLPLGTLTVTARGGAATVHTARDDGTVPLGALALDGVLWRISENDTAPCTPLLDALDACTTVVNPPACIQLCSSKWATHLALEAAGIPTVPTVYLPEGASVPDLGGTVVVKPDRGAGGRDVRTAQPGEPVQQALVAQPWAGDPSGHRRVLVCGGTPVAAVVRRAPEGAITNNLDAGGSGEVVGLGAEAEMAEAAAAALGAVVAGVDLVPDGAGWRVLEVNSNPGIDAERQAGGAQAVAAAVLDHVARRRG